MKFDCNFAMILIFFFITNFFIMKIPLHFHEQHPWIAHQLMTDFEVEDVWRFPVLLNQEHSIPLFQKQLQLAMEQLSQKGIAGWLFKLRLFLGHLFGWDKYESWEKDELKKDIPFKKGSLRERYSKANQLDVAQLPSEGSQDFIPVFVLDNESLAEIENATVHAGLHLGKVPYKDGYTVQMAVYVKPKGRLGKFYMALIKPFRLAIVYPVMMRLVGRQWTKFTSKR